MTWENCERLAKHCLKMDDEMGAMMYEERAARKKSRTTAYFEAQAKAAEKMNNMEGARKWREIAKQKKLTENFKPAEVKKDGKK